PLLPPPSPTPLPSTTLFRSHRHGSAARRFGARTQPAQPHDLRLETFSLLLPTDSGQSHALRRAGGVFPGNRKHRAAERGNSSPRDRKSTRLNSSHRTISYAV